MKMVQFILDKFSALLMLMSTISLISGCAGTKIASPDQLAAYKAAMAGRADDALNILKRSEDDFFSKFLLSCIELSEENLLEARRYADEFVASQPNIPDGKVLIELIEERKTYPSEPWTVSFVSAWKASGRPQLTTVSDFLLEGLIKETDSCENRKLPEDVIGTPDELLAATENGFSCDEKKFVELCLAHTSPETPTSIKLIALHGLDDINLKPSNCEGSNIPEDLVKHAQERRLKLLQQLTDELPLDIEFPVMAILDETSKQEKFSLVDIEKIEKAVSRPRLAPAPAELYNDYFKRFVSLRSSNPYASAAGASLSVDTFSYLFVLKRKIIATAEGAPSEVRERLAAILEKVGRAQVKHRTVTQLLLSLNLFYAATELRGDATSQEHYRAVFEFTKPLIQHWDVKMASGLWPIRPLVINSVELHMKDDIAFSQLFADVDSPVELLELLKD